MNRFATLLALLLAGCGWAPNEGSNTPSTAPSPGREKSNLTAETDSPVAVALDASVQAGLYGLVDGRYMFMVHPGHGLEASDTIDAHWVSIGGIRSGMTVTSATGYTIVATGGSGPGAEPLAQAVLMLAY